MGPDWPVRAAAGQDPLTTSRSLRWRGSSPSSWGHLVCVIDPCSAPLFLRIVLTPDFVFLGLHWADSNLPGMYYLILTLILISFCPDINFTFICY